MANVYGFWLGAAWDYVSDYRARPSSPAPSYCQLIGTPNCDSDFVECVGPNTSKYWVYWSMPNADRYFAYREGSLISSGGNTSTYQLMTPGNPENYEVFGNNDCDFRRCGWTEPAYEACPENPCASGSTSTAVFDRSAGMRTLSGCDKLLYRNELAGGEADPSLREEWVVYRAADEGLSPVAYSWDYFAEQKMECLRAESFSDGHYLVVEHMPHEINDRFILIRT